MFFAGIFLLFCATIPIYKAEIDCDAATCDNSCKRFGLENGVCRNNTCSCSTDKQCSKLSNVTCDVTCMLLNSNGECVDDKCVCKQENKLCLPTECREQCQEDPRFILCVLAGGAMIPNFCMEYGPLQTCGCTCLRITRIKRDINSLDNHPAGSSSEIDHYYTVTTL